MSRRRFLTSGCAACAGAVGAAIMAPKPVFGQGASRPCVRIVYALHAEVQPGPDWPNVGFDFRPVMERINAALSQNCPELDFVTATATGEDQAAAILEGDKNEKVDGYIVYQLNCWNRVAQTIATSGKPVLYADFQFGGSGGFLVYTAAFLRQGAPNLGFVASSDMDDIIAAAKCFAPTIKSGTANDFAALVAKSRVSNTPKPGDLTCKPDMVETLSVDAWKARIAESRILAVLDQEARPADPVMGIAIEYIAFQELNDAWEAADKDEARAIADEWQQNASRIEDVSRETLEQSAAMYLAEKAVLKKHNANAITINCLGGFYGGHIHAYPCLGFHELNNEGLIGACECDIRSTATMVAFTTLTQGRPGYISDPVIDTAKRQIIYAHCVASNKVFGPDGSKNAFEILTHSEDRQGAAVRSILPTEYMTTSLEVSQENKEILFHQAKAVANDPDDRACRTKLCGEPVGDMEKLFTQWDRWGWHRVTFYGDLKAPVFELADALGWKVLEEA
ncbi:MAG TPA: hypothetical protein ENN29_02210 [Candidatus Hydrogenedentes bacterium]|nr:hypothetical protein [Candidatus Hydrogenedentota bacterium]